MRHEMLNLCPFLQSCPLYVLSDCCMRLMRSVELVQAISLSYLFSCILLNLSAFLTSFLPITWSPGCTKLISLFPIYNSAHLDHLNLPRFWLLDPIPI